MENDSLKMLWDVTILIDHVIEERRPDMVITDKVKNESKIIHFECPFDSKIEEREKDKMKGYNDLTALFKVATSVSKFMCAQIDDFSCFWLK